MFYLDKQTTNENSNLALNGLKAITTF